MPSRMAKSRSSITSENEHNVNVSDEISQSGRTRKAAGEKMRNRQRGMSGDRTD